MPPIVIDSVMDGIANNKAYHNLNRMVQAQKTIYLYEISSNKKNIYHLFVSINILI